MGRQVIVFNGLPFPSDSANMPSTIVECDSNGDVVRSGFAVGSIPAAAPTTGNFLSILGALLLTASTQTGSVSLTNASNFLQKLSAASGATTTTLPAVSASANLAYCFVKSDATANIPTLKGNGSDPIITPAGSANTYAGLTAQGSHIILWCDGASWWQLA